MAESQNPLIQQAVVIGFIPGFSDMLQMSDGFYMINVYVAGDPSGIQPGQTYGVFRQGSTYYLGQRLNA